MRPCLAFSHKGDSWMEFDDVHGNTHIVICVDDIAALTINKDGDYWIRLSCGIALRVTKDVFEGVKAKIKRG